MKYVLMIVLFMIFIVLLISPTEQLPCLGGLYYQGRKTAVTTQVRVRAHTTQLHICLHE